MKKVRKLICLLLAILLIVAVAACTSQPADTPAADTPAPADDQDAQEEEPAPAPAADDEPVTVVIGFASGYLDEARGGVQFAEDIFAKMADDHPNIRPEVMVMVGADTTAGWDVYFTQILTMAAAGNAPDVFHVAIEGIQSLVRMGVAEPIDFYLDANPEFRDEALADIHPNLQAPFVIEGRTYTLVNDWNNVVVHINTNMLDEAGLDIPPDDWDLDMFMQYAEALTRVVDGEQQFGFSIPSYYFAYSNWLKNNNTNFLSPDMTEVTFDSPESIEIMQLMQDLVHVYGYAPAPGGQWDVILLVEGTVAMLCAGRWPVATYVGADFTDVVIKPIPFIQSQNVTFGSGGSVVFSGSDVKYEAAAVVAWQAGNIYQTEMYGVSNIPSRRSVADAIIALPGVPMNPELFFGTANIASPVQSPPAYNDLEGIFNRFMSAVLANEMSAEDACTQAAAEMRDALQRNPT